MSLRWAPLDKEAHLFSLFLYLISRDIIRQEKNTLDMIFHSNLINLSPQESHLFIFSFLFFKKRKSTRDVIFKRNYLLRPGLRSYRLLPTKELREFISNVRGCSSTLGVRSRRFKRWIARINKNNIRIKYEITLF